MFTTASRVPVRMQSREQTGCFPDFFLSLTDFLRLSPTMQDFTESCVAQLSKDLCSRVTALFDQLGGPKVTERAGGPSGAILLAGGFSGVGYVLPHASHQSGSKVMGKAAAAPASKQAPPTSPVQLHHRLFASCSLLID